MHPADEIASLQQALKAPTWGEFRVQAGPRRYREALERLLSIMDAWTFVAFCRQHRPPGDPESLRSRYRNLPIGARVPERDDRFSPKQIPGFCEGVWPERPRSAVQGG